MATKVNLDHTAAAAAAELAKTLLGDEKGKEHVCGKAKKVTAADADNLVTKALGVVAESGVFACGLFLLSKSGKAVTWTGMKGEEVAACHTLHRLIRLSEAEEWEGVQPRWSRGVLDPERINEKKRAIIPHLVEVSSVELPQLLMIRQVWEQMLIYARYMMRSMREKE